MTYGWSILVVAVVLGALAYLGVFNPLYFAPKANPGNCQVFRPNGAGTSYDINLLGVCNGEIPEFVAEFNGNGAGIAYSSNTYITSVVPAVENANVFTVTMWVYVPNNPQGNMPFFGEGSYQALELFRGGVGSAVDQIGLHRCNGADTWESAIPVISLNQWHFIAVSVNQPNYLFQIDSANSIVTNTNSWSNNDLVVMGTQTTQCDGSVFVGDISNVQIYNASLDQNSITALYQEGIGGAPIDLQNLVGWWPLNGNANDYSGNGNNGVPTNVVYTSSWISSYNPP